jgi:hypothetical protein
MKIALLFVLVGCAGSSGNQHVVADGGGGNTDAPTGCLSITITPPFPQKGDHIKATAVAMASGVASYTWQVNGLPNTNYEAPDESAIGFDVPDAVSYEVGVSIPDDFGCPPITRTINVTDGNGLTKTYRMRVIPPADLAPPQENEIVVVGGQTSEDRPFYVDPGLLLHGSVTSGATPVPAYVKFTPVLGPSFDLVTTGTFQARLQMHSALVIPQDNTLAPRVIAWTPVVGPNQFAVDGGVGSSGTVLDRSGAPLANAQVQLEQLGVPSTIATTAANGTFTVHTTFDHTNMITAIVTPPPASGLARLSATAVFDLTQSMQISYVGSPATCDLAATPVKRGGANQGGAVVTIVGPLSGAGTVTTGGVAATATGMVHITATANGGGSLPSTLVPRANLGAVVQLAPADFAVTSIDTTACAAQTLTAPVQVTASGVMSNGTIDLVGARIEAVPVGTLALASLLPVQTTVGAGGAFTLQLASGGHYDMRFYDPGGRGAELELPDLTPAGVPNPVTLGTALAITGELTVLGYANPVIGASVQLLCADCTGIAASQPLAQTATDITGHYRIAVPDPGTMPP